MIRRAARQPLCLLLFLLGIAFWNTPRADVEIPALRARVTDLTGTLSGRERELLEQRLAAFEQRKGSQIAVLVVPGTQPESIEQFGIRVVDRWKLGREGIDDGVLVLIAKDDRTARIEVGRGLEGAIPDAIAKRIIDEIMIPLFRQGDFYGGLAAGIDRVIAASDGEALPAPPNAPANDGDGGAAFVSLFLSMFLGRVLRTFLGRLAAGIITGSGLTLLLTGLFGLPLPFALFLGLFAFAFVVGDSSRRGRGYYTGSGYGGGYSGGGFDGSSGGFSAGGGGFSGGGASGKW